jgi:hypothetical protein
MGGGWGYSLSGNGGRKMVETVSRHLAPSPPIFFTSMYERKVIFCNEFRRGFVDSQVSKSRPGPPAFNLIKRYVRP